MLYAIQAHGGWPAVLPSLDAFFIETDDSLIICWHSAVNSHCFFPHGIKDRIVSIL